jgi:hypothetical protein
MANVRLLLLGNPAHLFYWYYGGCEAVGASRKGSDGLNVERRG